MVKLNTSEYELSDKAGWLQRQRSSLHVSKCALEENPLQQPQSSNCRQNKALLRLAEPQQKVRFQPHSVSTVKVRTFIGKEWDPETWGGDVW